MKILVFSDVHGNFTSLKTLTQTEDFKTADKRIFLGDIVMGCCRANECISLIEKMDCECLLGNNDSYICWKMPKDVLETASEGKKKRMLFIQESISEENKKIVSSRKKDLFMQVGKIKLYFTHYPWESEEDVVDSPFEDPSVTYTKIFENIDADYIFFGHEHQVKKSFDGKKHYNCLGALGVKNPGYYLVIETDGTNISIKEKWLNYDMEEEFAYMDKIGFAYDKNKVKKN